MKSDLLQELESATKYPVSDPPTQTELKAILLVMGDEGFSGSDWQGLSSGAQTWYNTAAIQFNAGKPIPIPGGEARPTLALRTVRAAQASERSPTPAASVDEPEPSNLVNLQGEPLTAELQAMDEPEDMPPAMDNGGSEFDPSHWDEPAIETQSEDTPVVEVPRRRGRPKKTETTVKTPRTPKEPTRKSDAGEQLREYIILHPEASSEAVLEYAKTELEDKVKAVSVRSIYSTTHMLLRILKRNNMLVDAA